MYKSLVLKDCINEFINVSIKTFVMETKGSVWNTKDTIKVLYSSFHILGIIIIMTYQKCFPVGLEEERDRVL